MPASGTTSAGSRLPPPPIGNGPPRRTGSAPASAEPQAPAGRDLPPAPVPDAGGGGERGRDEAGEGRPEPGGLAGQVGGQRVDGHPSGRPGAIAPVGAVADGRSDIAADGATARGARTLAEQLGRAAERSSGPPGPHAGVTAGPRPGAPRR